MSTTKKYYSRQSEAHGVGPASDRSNRGVALHVLFICTGNICRSPTAERLAVAFNRQFEIPDFTASSAGLHALIGHPVHREAATVLAELGGDVSNFSARQLNSKIASNADLVLTMTKEHRNAVLEMAPRQLRRTFTLGEAARLASDFEPEDLSQLAGLRPRLPANEARGVPDPIGQGPEVFASVGALIAELLTPVLSLCRRSIISGPAVTPFERLEN